jgi:hypothetical protein
MRALAEEREARRVLTEALREAPFDAYFWETPPMNPDDEQQEAELAVVESVALGRSVADPSSFRAAFRAAHGRIATFSNLSGDAVLVAPIPEAGVDGAHLAAFLRTAPESAAEALWIAVSEAVATWRLQRRQPVWVSTSGLGVPWLHVRLDGTPKYYSHRPYAAMRTVPIR